MVVAGRRSRSRRPDRPTYRCSFTFMRDAEMRFETLRIRIEDTVAASTGELVSVMEATFDTPWPCPGDDD